MTQVDHTSSAIIVRNKLILVSGKFPHLFTKRSFMDVFLITNPAMG